MTNFKTMGLLSLVFTSTIALAGEHWDAERVKAKLVDQGGRVGDCSAVALIEPTADVPLLGIRGRAVRGNEFIKTVVHRCGRRDCYALRFVQDKQVISVFTVYEASSGVLTGLERPNLIYRFIVDDRGALGGIIDQRGRTICGPRLD